MKAVIDDEAELEALADHLVRISPCRGLGAHEVEQALAVLGVGSGSLD